jgi:hypothetical protein
MNRTVETLCRNGAIHGRADITTTAGAAPMLRADSASPSDPPAKIDSVTSMQHPG